MFTIQQNNAFTLWARAATENIQLATGTAYGTIFGVAYSSDIWFRFSRRFLYLHRDSDTDVKAIMERRGN